MNSLSRSAGGMPGPLSATMTRATPLTASRRVSTRSVGGSPSGRAAAWAAAERLDGVVDQVDDDAADLLDVHADRRQARSRTAARSRFRETGRCRGPAFRSTAPFRSDGTVFGAGIRANCANSSTSALSDSTSPTIVVVHSSTSSRDAGGADVKWRRIRSAQSWIGVSGFLISCASRRATSRQAATRCVRISGVTSSKHQHRALEAAVLAAAAPSRPPRGAVRGRRARARTPGRPPAVAPRLFTQQRRRAT